MPTWTEGRIGKYRPVMIKCKCGSMLNVWRNGYHWGLIISHPWWSGIFEWCLLSKEPWHSQLPPAAGCLLLSTGHAPAAEAAGRKERMLMAQQHFFTVHCLEASSPSWAVWGKMHETEQLKWVTATSSGAVTISKGWDGRVALSKSSAGRLARALM